MPAMAAALTGVVSLAMLGVMAVLSFMALAEVVSIEGWSVPISVTRTLSDNSMT